MEIHDLLEISMFYQFYKFVALFSCPDTTERYISTALFE